MAEVINDIEAKIRSLTPQEKTKLLRSLIAELDGASGSDVQTEWVELAKRRYREIIEEKVTPVPGDRVFEHVRLRAKQ